jgi:hypothetical protein
MPSPVQKAIAVCVPKKDTWTIKCKKVITGDWVFDIPPFIKNEAITGGSDAVIDAYYIHINSEPPNVDDTITITATTHKPEYHHEVIKNFKKDVSGFGHTAVAQNVAMDVWFCPVMEVMFGYTPSQMWVTFA